MQLEEVFKQAEQHVNKIEEDEFLTHELFIALCDPNRASSNPLWDSIINLYY